MKSLFFCFTALLFSLTLWAQDPADIFYRTIPMDSVEELSLSVYPNDSLAVQVWPGNHLMIETSVMLYNGKQRILEFMKEQGRWDFTDELAGKRLTLVSKDQERRLVKSDRGSMTEDVVIVIYVPEDFEAIDQLNWRRKEPK
ncbi:MAG: hypothetical protein AAF828_03305 [Bacteroidota bacterium]